MGREVLPPGFRFHPTDEELVLHYLKRKSCAGKFEDGIIGEVDLYSHEPWDLPEKSALCSRDPEWYFFNARDKKYPHGSRTNRATKAGYWKGTGKDRSVCSGGCTVGMKKTLVYYLGRAPNGELTDWIMHEYRLDEEFEKRRKILSNFVLCRIRKKSGPGLRNGEQYGAPVLDEENEIVSASECILGDVTNEALPRLYENNDQQEHADVSKKPGFRGCFKTSSNEMDLGGMEGLNSGEELEAFLRDLLSNESQDEFAVEGHESKAKLLSAAYFDDEAGSSSVEHSGSLEPLQSSSMQALSRSPNLSGVYFHGLENLHNVLHPAPDEAEILGEVLQTLAAGGDVTYHSANSSMDQNEGILPQALAQNQDLVRNDYLEFAGPPENLLFTLPELETTGFETSEEEGSPCSEDLGIEIRSHSKRIQEELHGHGTAAWRARLQLLALPVGSSSSSASPGVINKMHLSVHSNKWLRYKCECRSTETSNYKMRKLGVFVTRIISITDHIRLFKSLSGDFRVFFFWLPISVLRFLYPFQGFWRLAKRAFANFGRRTVM